jgi:hypothetical protein
MNTEPNAGWRYYEGQHRAAAQLDQGASDRRATVGAFDPATGLPIRQ